MARGWGGGLLFANLVDFDQLYGHRDDVAGFYVADWFGGSFRGAGTSFLETIAG